jgi:hypothetical protein
MESEVPELILPDPTPETANSFYCKKVGLFSRDFEVYRDPEREQDKWLVIDTEGGLFDDNAYICGKREATCHRESLHADSVSLCCTQSRTTSARRKARLVKASVCAMPGWTSSTTTTTSTTMAKSTWTRMTRTIPQTAQTARRTLMCSSSSRRRSTAQSLALMPGASHSRPASRHACESVHVRDHTPDPCQLMACCFFGQVEM